MSNFLTQDRNTPSAVNAISGVADKVSNQIQGNNQKLQDDVSSFENYADKIGLAPGFLGREDSSIEIWNVKSWSNVLKIPL